MSDVCAWEPEPIDESPLRTVRVVCDRCNGYVEGVRFDGPRGFTSGYYDCKPPSSWAKYADQGEEILCDSCMHTDPRYKADYFDLGPVGVDDLELHHWEGEGGSIAPCD